MTTIYLNNIWARVEGDATLINQRLAALEAELPDYTLRHVDGRFLVGVAGLVADKSTKFVDERVGPDAICTIPKFLRDYQHEAVLAAIHANRGIIMSPTGSGKTAIAAGILGAVPITWAYLVPAPSLAASVANWLRTHLNEPVGEVHGSVKKVEGRIMVATFDSVHNYKPAADFLAHAAGLLVDEVHRVASKTAMACVLHAKDAFFRLGLSATPFQRSDAKNILVQGLIGPVFHEVKVDRLVAAGAVAELDFHWVRSDHDIDYKGGWPEFYNQFVVNAIRRNRGIALLADGIPKPAFIFVKTKEHAQIVLSMLQPKFGGRVAAVTGDVSVEERTKIIKRLNDRSLEIVVATKVFFEGIDAPEIACVVNATAFESAIEAIQIAGRGSRITPTKSRCYIVDFADRGHRWFENHTLARYEAYKAAGYTVPHPFTGLIGDYITTEKQAHPVRWGLLFCILSALLAIYLGAR